MENHHAEEFDLRLERRLRRRSISNHSRKKKPCKRALIKKRQGNNVIELVKPEKIVAHGGYSSACGFETVANAVNDDNYEDHEYMVFCKNLKEDGNDLALVVHHDNGEPEVLRYGVPDQWALKAPGAVENSAPNRKTKFRRILKEVSGGGKEEVSASWGREFSGEGDVPSQRALRSQARKGKKLVLENSGFVPIPTRDSLAMRKASGKTRAESKMRLGSVSDCSVESSMLSGERDVPSQRALGSQVRNAKKRVVENSGIVPITTRKRLVVRKASGETRAESKMRLGSVHKCSVEPKGDCVDDEYARLVNCDLVERDCDHHYVDDDHDEPYVKLLRRLADERSGKSNSGPSSYGNHLLERDVGEDLNGSAEEEYSDGSEYDDVCEDYLAFLTLLEMKGEDMFDETDDSESDSDLIVLGEDFHINRPPSLIIDLEADTPSEDPGANCSEFKMELLEVLNMPYNSNQHQELKHEFECRRPITEDRNLRAKTITYQSKTKLGKSYLANYPEFARLFDLAKDDKRKSLNLLRGFFFWLKNITRDGAFKPWQYPQFSR